MVGLWRGEAVDTPRWMQSQQHFDVDDNVVEAELL